MRRYVWGALLAIVLVAAVPGSAAGRTYELDYATYDVFVTDSQGVRTEAWDFGFYNGPNVVTAKRGDGYVDIPFRRIRRLEIGRYIPSKGYSPCTVTSLTNRTYQVAIERIESRRYLGGETDLGSYRIRLGQVQTLELVRLTPEEDL